MPIVDIHALDANYTSGGRGMQELAVPEVDADVCVGARLKVPNGAR